LKSVRNPVFKKLYFNLPKEIQTQADKTFHLWKENRHHPSLHFKKIDDSPIMYSIRIGLNWRALCVQNLDTYIWFWIGSHEDYNQLIKQKK